MAPEFVCCPAVQQARHERITNSDTSSHVQAVSWTQICPALEIRPDGLPWPAPPNARQTYTETHSLCAVGTNEVTQQILKQQSKTGVYSYNFYTFKALKAPQTTMRLVCTRHHRYTFTYLALFISQSDHPVGVHQ